MTATSHTSDLVATTIQLEQAGLLTVTTDPDGSVRYTLTDEGEREARGIALSGDESALDAVLDTLARALLEQNE